MPSIDDRKKTAIRFLAFLDSLGCGATSQAAIAWLSTLSRRELTITLLAFITALFLVIFWYIVADKEVNDPRAVNASAVLPQDSPPRTPTMRLSEYRDSVQHEESP